ncbi:MAG: SDR family oxidoreductase [Rhodospirillaceae bacterium]|nr:SDR family oxidoreductase [Rhodospirillaceae bacterium]
MDLGIKGRRAIVCAASRGLGRASAFSLARNGVDLVINGRDTQVLEETAQAIREETGVSVETVAGDISDPAVQAAMIDARPEPDILVNNNGGPPRRDFREIDRDAFLQGVVMNMATPVEMIGRVVDGMAERGFGRIVNITSISVKMPVPGLDLSSGARAGLTAFIAGVASGVVARNVTINNLLPGYFDTARLRSNIAAGAKATGADLTAFTDAQMASVPAKRFGDPAEFGEACAFLCSAQAGYITGQNLVIDGGRYSSVW